MSRFTEREGRKNIKYFLIPNQNENFQGLAALDFKNSTKAFKAFWKFEYDLHSEALNFGMPIYDGQWKFVEGILKPEERERIFTSSDFNQDLENYGKPESNYRIILGSKTFEEKIQETYWKIILEAQNESSLKIPQILNCLEMRKSNAYLRALVTQEFFDASKKEGQIFYYQWENNKTKDYSYDYSSPGRTEKKFGGSKGRP